MFVRIRQTKGRLQVSLNSAHRVDGKVHHEQVAILGTVDASPSVAGRFAFRQSLHERMSGLGNPLDAATQAKLLGDIHARIPMVARDELWALQLANAPKPTHRFGMLAIVHARTVESTRT